MESDIHKKRPFLLPIIILVTGLIIFVFVKMYYQKSIAVENIEQRLRSAAASTKSIISDSLIENAQLKKPMNIIVQDSLRMAANKIADIHKVVYVYVVIRSGDSTLFVLSSYIDEDITNNLVTDYLDEYSEATPEMISAFGSNKKEIFDRSIDVWGSFYSVYIPCTTEKGTPYLLCADVRSSELFDRQLDYLVEFTLSAVFLLLIMLPMLLAIRRPK